MASIACRCSTTSEVNYKIKSVQTVHTDGYTHTSTVRTSDQHISSASKDPELGTQFLNNGAHLWLWCSGTGNRWTLHRPQPTMKLSVSAYRAHASAHKKILSSSYQSTLNYGSTAASSSSNPPNNLLSVSTQWKIQLICYDWIDIVRNFQFSLIKCVAHESKLIRITYKYFCPSSVLIVNVDTTSNPTCFDVSHTILWIINWILWTPKPTQITKKYGMNVIFEPNHQYLFWFISNIHSSSKSS